MPDEMTPWLAACLIVKNAAETIERCLASLRPFVDEVNIYDTGSRDDTLPLLAALGARRSEAVDDAEAALAPIRVERGEWRDDFAWARQRSFEMASPNTTWLVWADADDEIEGGAALRDLATSAPDEIDGFICLYEVPFQEGGTRSRLWRERLVRADRDFRWTGVVHENLTLADRRAHMHVVDPARIRWIHRESPNRWDSGRNLELLLREEARAQAAGQSPDSRVVLQLGNEHMRRGDFGAAARYLAEYVERTRDTRDDLRLAATNQLAACLRALGDASGALERELEAWRARPDWPQTALGIAESHAALGHWNDVVLWSDTAFEADLPQTLAPVPVTRLRILPALLRAQAKLALGDGDAAAAAFSAAAGREPADDELRGLSQAFAARVAEGDLAGATVVLRLTTIRVDENLHAMIRAAPVAVAGDTES